MNYLCRARRKALVLSPAASHPDDFGNRRRVFQTCSFLKKQGYEIHFLLYPMEPDWMERVQDAARDMRREWDSFQIVPSSRPLPLQTPARGEHHTIDEWWDPTIGTYLEWLFAREHFDLFVVNYVFMTKSFEYAGPRTVKVLETHDRFSGRKELLMTLGARIESFYTSEDEEKIALDRSDIVVAIKETEADFYRSLTAREVITVPFWLEQSHFAARVRAGDSDRALNVGFIGALNVVNVANVSAFLREFETNPAVVESPLLLHIAGEVCHQVTSIHPKVRLLGRVQSLEEFYGGLDAVVVPMTLSTGLKIKTGEALAFGKAVVAITDGFDGFPPVDAFHCLESFSAVCRALAALARDRVRLDELELRSRITAQLARRRMEVGYRKLAVAISRFLPTILVITDQPLFQEGNVQVERLAQWCQLCSTVATTVVGYDGLENPAAARPELTQTDIVRITNEDSSPDRIFSAWNELELRHSISEIIISMGGERGRLAWEIARKRCANVTLDTWHSVLHSVAREHGAVAAPDYWISGDVHDSDKMRSTTALRYRPRILDGWRAGRPEGILVVVSGADDCDRRGIELLRDGSDAADASGSVTLAFAPGGELDPGFFENLSARKKPAIIIGVGSDERAISICRSLAAIFEIVCFSVATNSFPVALDGADGRATLCASWLEFAQCCRDIEDLARSASCDRADTGWRRYKDGLVRRVSAANAGQRFAGARS